MSVQVFEINQREIFLLAYACRLHSLALSFHGVLLLTALSNPHLYWLPYTNLNRRQFGTKRSIVLLLGDSAKRLSNHMQSSFGIKGTAMLSYVNHSTWNLHNSRALYSYFHEPVNSGTAIELKFRDEDRIGFPYIVCAYLFLILLTIKASKASKEF